MPKHIIKMAILGDSGTGKSSIIQAREKLQFQDQTKLTIGVDVSVLPFEYSVFGEDHPTFLALDLGGKSRFHFIHDAYLTGIKSAMIVYDLTRYWTFKNIWQKWYKLIYNENPMIPVVIVGTKLDLIEEDRKNFFEKEFRHSLTRIPNPNNILGHYFISVKDSDGLEQLFLDCEEMMEYTYELEKFMSD